MPQPLSPSPEYLSAYLQRWEGLENYRLQEQSLALLFKELCPSNNVLEQVLLKVSALNDFYSTNIFDTYTVAKHIREMDIESRLKNGDLSLVNELAMVSIRDKKWNFYSFASKYCSHHFPESFPIFDSYVEKMLLHYAHADNFYSFHKGDLKHYESFVKIIKEFQTHYGLRQFSLRQIDIFLWLAGKDSFPPSYKSGITRRSSRTAQKRVAP
ncbi:hypothetical protein [Methylophilus sp. 14]|uniref:hypothetical protein n=1 Tax=Methylophilus sp. 14 TaxID=2781019 RepID=UPI00189090CB|nr:hypothetical protein [Methylophilus sp. 14]MBF4989399.1 hypothetical protein [Methylophilus sp. 14]